MSETLSNGSKSGLNWPTVALIIATGGANLIGTHQGTTTLSAEQQEGLRKIREVHEAMDEFEKRQKQALDTEQEILRLLRKQ